MSALALGVCSGGAAADIGAPLQQSFPNQPAQIVARINMRPIILGQHALSTQEATPLTIELSDLIVRDRDDAWPEDFTLRLRSGSNYALTGPTEITPSPGFIGAITVPVTVNDGHRDSAVFSLLVTVRRPNIVVLMLDDLDTRSLDDLLAAQLMPNLQTQIIDRGLTFSEAYVSTPLCCPSRATFLTGQYPHNTGIVANEVLFPDAGIQHAVALFDDSVTIATRLQSLGYTTAHVGKYLNGYGSDPSLASLSPALDPHYVPPGWSHWRALVDYSTYCVYDYTVNAAGVLADYRLPTGQSEDSGIYQTNVLAGLAESFLRDHVDDAAPFYLEVMPIAPHWELCDEAYGGLPHEGKFDMRIRPDPRDATAVVPAFVPSPAYDEDLSDKPGFMSGIRPLTAADLASVSEQYQQRLRSMLSVDRLLGRVIAALGPSLDHTVIVVISDNGWFYGEHRVSEKMYAYRESARVPLYIVAPGVEPGTRSSFVLNNDVAPTLLDLASPGYADAAFDGRSIVPLLREPQPPGWTDRSQFLIEYSRSDLQKRQYPTYAALRSASQLYIESRDGVYYQTLPQELIGLELYDLAADPNEMSSLIHYPENGRDATLAPRLDQLSGCAGVTCRIFENATGLP